MAKYPEERKQAVLSKLLPPNNQSVQEVAVQEGICDKTLYNWLNQLREEGLPVPGNEKNAQKWSAEVKFAVVVETASLSESELGQYCREKGLYPEQVKSWKEACIAGNLNIAAQKKVEQLKSKDDKKLIKQLEKELRRKDKALAEAATLLVLSKKLDTLYGVSQDEEN